MRLAPEWRWPSQSVALLALFRAASLAVARLEGKAIYYNFRTEFTTITAVSSATEAFLNPPISRQELAQVGDTWSFAAAPGASLIAQPPVAISCVANGQDNSRTRACQWATPRMAGRQFAVHIYRGTQTIYLRAASVQTVANVFKTTLENGRKQITSLDISVGGVTSFDYDWAGATLEVEASADVFLAVVSSQDRESLVVAPAAATIVGTPSQDGWITVFGGEPTLIHETCSDGRPSEAKFTASWQLSGLPEYTGRACRYQAFGGALLGGVAYSDGSGHGGTCMIPSSGAGEYALLPDVRWLKVIAEFPATCVDNWGSTFELKGSSELMMFEHRRECALQFTGSQDEGTYRPCVFPFIYRSVQYNECTTDGNAGKGYHWCATEVNSEGSVEGAWEKCACKVRQPAGTLLECSQPVVVVADDASTRDEVNIMSPSLCQPGFYDDISPLGSCKRCPEGSSSAEVDAKSCTACPTGRTSSNSQTFTGAEVLDAMRCALVAGHGATIAKTIESVDFPRRAGNTGKPHRAAFICEVFLNSSFVAAEASYLVSPDANNQNTASESLPMNNVPMVNWGDLPDGSGGYFSFGIRTEVIDSGGMSGTLPEDGLISFARIVFNQPEYIVRFGFSQHYPADVNSAWGFKVSNLRLKIWTPQIECDSCAPGRYFDTDVGCEPCAPGRYRNESGSFTMCEPCPLGWSSEAGRSTCALCPAGTIVDEQDGVRQCIVCPLGHYSINPLQTACTQCPPGQFGDIRGLSSCRKCTAGTFLSSSAAQADLCQKCPPGKISGSNSSICVNCPAGKYNADAGGISCQNCTRGRFVDIGAEACNDCERGKFAELFGQSACEECAAGSYSANLGSSICNTCMPGQFSPSFKLACRSCEAGTHAGADGMSACADCAVGRYNDYSNAHSCLFCEAGTYSGTNRSTSCIDCGLGSFAAQRGQSKCSLCAAGSYNGLRKSSNCPLCGKGTFSSLEGATAAAACFLCYQGSFASTEGSSACMLCSVGKYLAFEGGRKESDCKLCPGGKFNSAAGVGALEVCQECPRGTRSSSDGGSCQACAGGHFSGSGSDTCTRCPKGTYAPARVESLNHRCSYCPDGRYGISSGAIDINVCVPCVPGRVSSYNKSSCENCPPGTYRSADFLTCKVCSAGYFAHESSSTACKQCPPGKYRSEENIPAISCESCMAGTVSTYWAATSSSVCEDCAAGTHSSDDGQSCLLCPSDTYGAFPGLSFCASCPSGGDPLHTPPGAQACCPQHSLTWPLQHAALLHTPPGKSRTPVHRLSMPCDVASEDTTALQITPQDSSLQGSLGTEGSSVMYLATLHKGSVHDCVEIRCASGFGESCALHVHADLSIFEPGDGLVINALVNSSTHGGHQMYRCPQSATVQVAGFGCEGDTVRFFFLALTGFIVLTVVAGLALEASGRSRISLLYECNVSLQVPSTPTVALPSVDQLWNAICQGLNVSPDRLPRINFAAWLGHDPKRAGEQVLHAQFAVRVAWSRRDWIRQRLVQTSWIPDSSLPGWEGAEQSEGQLPKIVKAKGRAPGTDLIVMLEGFILWIVGTGRRGAVDDQQARDLHESVAHVLLIRLMGPRARLCLALQCTCNYLAAFLLPVAASYRMTSCEAGYPNDIHCAWLGYIVASNITSLTLLCLLGGRDSAAFVRRHAPRILLRLACSCVMLTDTYQDATFPVIASACGFDLWFVSAWLVFLGVLVMQVCAQLVVLYRCFQAFRRARTPEERDRLSVEGLFLALRGSDNLVLVYAIRPAVEERLGGASSWAMKTSEARIAFFRFMFEDVEQSALQMVFLLFYEDAATFDKIWVSLSISTALLLSLTLVVQCLPEVRDWLWHRLLARLPGSTLFPPCRALWLLLFLVTYRALSAFPWVSACSPVGDTCEEDGSDFRVGSSNFCAKLWCCIGNERMLLGRPAQEQILHEVGTNSGMCVIGLASSFIVAALIWWVRQLFRRCGRRRLTKHEAYSLLRRFPVDMGGGPEASSLEGLAQTALRPRADEDEDGWLKAAHRLLDETRAYGSHAKIKRLVQKIDRSLYVLSRSHAYQWYLKLNLPRQLKHLPDLVIYGERLSDAAVSASTQLCEQGKRVLDVAEVRWRIRRLLASRKFLKAHLLGKAGMIHDATQGRAPLRFVHYETLEACCHLPKCGSPNGSFTAPELVSQIAKQRQVTSDVAERWIVPFFLSHRWLRTHGPQSAHHPDTESGVKAKALVAFAHWFMSFAQQKGLLCEVVFWIDWCCAKQDDAEEADISAAALPLYIASCLKVVTWQTRDFDRRCWLMVERLLCYSFCLGGLTPYVIDETVARERRTDVGDMDRIGSDASTGFMSVITDDIPRADDSINSHSTEIWQVLLGQEWTNYEEHVQTLLRSARAQGGVTARITVRGQGYMVDFQSLSQQNLTTGARRRVRTVPAPHVLGRVRAEGRPLVARSASGMSSGETLQTVHRRATKLPNPLDFEACRVTRASDRRHIAQLVDLALAVPALEVFADRQPVEFGLSEIVEQSLVERSSLPMDSRARDGTFVHPPPAWLVPIESRRTDWRLLVQSAEEAVSGIGGSSVQHADMLVWVDQGIELPVDMLPPTVDQIDAAFRRVDDTFNTQGMATASGIESALDHAVRDLIVHLKLDLRTAILSEDDDTIYAALARARDVEMSERRRAVEIICVRRLEAALDALDEDSLRRAMNAARALGCEHLDAYRRAHAAERKLFHDGLATRLNDQLAVAEAERDINVLAAVHRVAITHALHDLATRALWLGVQQLQQASLAGDMLALSDLRRAADEQGWKDLVDQADIVTDELTMERGLAAAAVADDTTALPALRAIEDRAQQVGRADIAARAAKQIQTTAARVGARMGLPASWDVVHQLAAGAEVGRLFKTSEETATRLVRRMQQLVDLTYTGWGGLGKATRTRDRASEPIADRLEVKSVIYIQNSESFLNYRARRTQVAAEIPRDAPVAAAWDVKTSHVTLAGVGRHRENPVDHTINEYYLWHGTSPESAAGIAQTRFDIGRAGSVYGMLYGPGIYLAESCMKADEYTRPDRRGWRPLILCRVALGHVLYSDDAAPVPRTLEAACRPGGGFHSVLGDREKLRRTFREFVIYDSHQVYPEYIVWYIRK